MSANARALLAKYGMRAKKAWSQNFLVEDRAFAAIVDACKLGRDDWAVEIGAGLGTLTARLADAAAHVVAVERERDMLHVLRSELGEHPRIELVEADALAFDYAAVATRAGRKPVVVGNLPYAIASPLLFRLFEQRRSLARIVVMLQKEMADRIVAGPDSREYGALSVMVRLYGEPRLVCRVRAGSFVPPPRVDSAVLRIEPYADGATRVAVDETRFGKVVHAAFNQRRKTLRNALGAAFDMGAVDRGLAAATIDGQRRGETLSVEEFARLTEALHASLPEVEMVVRTLRPRLVGERIEAVETSGLPLRRPVDRRALERACVGARVDAVRRIGKYWLIDLSNQQLLLGHLGMSGRLVFAPATEPRPPHTHVVFTLRRKLELRYVDPRRFGVLRAYAQADAAASPELTVLGVDPLAGDFTVGYLAAALARSKRDLKAFLMDQSCVAGLGNIYVCEALHRAELAPTRRGHTVGAARAERLHGAIVAALADGIANRGTSFSDYVDADGASGANQHALAVYGREGEPCPRCGGAVRRLVQAGRSTFFCRRCQK